MVWQVLELLESGMSVEEITTHFIAPLTKEQIKAALRYATAITRGSDNIVVGIDEAEVSA